MNDIVIDLREKLIAFANPEKAIAMKRYMKNNVDFLGIYSPDRKFQTKSFIENIAKKDNAFIEEIVADLWELPEREFQYIAIDLLVKTKKKRTEDSLQLIDFLLENKSWWDTVDALSVNVAGDFLLRFPHLKSKATERWRNSNFLWKERCAIIFQLKYKLNIDHQLLEELIAQFATSKEFFRQKAIGWILREISKTKPELTHHFLIKYPQLSNLAKREASKYLQIEFK
jgi:3-methyladenine DNA glycosylase AlkD